MCTLIDDIFLDSLETVKDHSTRATLDVVDGELADEESGGGRDSPSGDVAEDVGHIGG